MTSIMVISQVALVALLLLATRYDLLSHKIPNALSIGGAVMGLTLATTGSGAAGLVQSLAGLAVGLVGLLPFHLRKAMGAGDVKLMAAVGSFVGPVTAGLALCFTLIIGALLAIGLLVTARFTARDPLDSLLSSDGATTGFRRVANRSDRFPYAAAILFGTLAALIVNGTLPRTLATIGLIRSGGG